MDWNFFLCLPPHAAAARAPPIAGKVTYVNYKLFPTAPRILGPRHDILLYFLPRTLDNRSCPKWTEAGTFPQITPSHCN